MVAGLKLDAIAMLNEAPPKPERKPPRIVAKY